VYHGTSLLSDCVQSIDAVRTEMQKPGFPSSGQKAVQAVPTGTTPTSAQTAALSGSTFTLPESLIVFSPLVGVDFVPTPPPSNDAASSPLSPLLTGAWKRGCNRPDWNLVSDGPGLTSNRMPAETITSAKKAPTCRIHPVRPHRRRGIYEKRNADQCAPAGRKPDRHC